MCLRNYPMQREPVCPWVEWKLGYLVWLHRFHQPDNPAWGASDAWSAAGNSHLWYVWRLGVGWEWQSRAGIGVSGIPKRLGGLFPQKDGCSASLSSCAMADLMAPCLPGKDGPAALPALAVRSHALSCMRSGTCPTPWWSGSACVAMRNATQQGGLGTGSCD